MSDIQLALPGVFTGADHTGEWVWTEDIEDSMSEHAQPHATVMREEVVNALAPGAATYVDATLGAGGHAEGILAAHAEARVIGFDRDERALAIARARLAPFGERVTFVHAPFSRVRDQLDALGVDRVAGLCADLGVSSMQLDEADRGMSFRREGPIDMRMDMRSGETALELMERLSDDELADVIFRYGDERRSRRIARSLKRALGDGELRTTLDLRRAIVRAVGPVRIGGVDPATRTFQALRIAVNEETEELEALLRGLPGVLASGGVAALLSFHSLEDRLVKRAFQQNQWAPLWKKPLGPSEEERAKNPRARSAKLRVARLVQCEEGP
jgi:16S rRNA (cytosine1402-N4)-methyltransferase